MYMLLMLCCGNVGDARQELQENVPNKNGTEPPNPMKSFYSDVWFGARRTDPPGNFPKATYRLFFYSDELEFFTQNEGFLKF